MNRVAEELKTQIQFSLLPISRVLKPHENMVVKVRLKDCASAIDKLRQFNPIEPSAGRNPGGVFDPDMPEAYNLLSLRDLVGVRVLAFPSSRLTEVDGVLRSHFPDWVADPIVDTVTEQRLAFKYNGLYTDSDTGIPCEYQIVSTLIGLFWEVEHAAIYKQSPSFKGLAPVMREQTSDVYRTLKVFEDQFERLIEESE